MNKLYLLLVCCATMILSCKKGSNLTTNVTNNTLVPTSVAAFTVDGVQNVTINSSTNINYMVSMPITVEYHDSVQQTVTLSISGAPTFIFCGTSSYNSGGYLISTGPWTGTPTFTIPIEIYSIATYTGPYYASGTYPITVTCASTLSGTKTFTFNIIAQ